MPFIEPQYPPLAHHLRVPLYFATEDGKLESEIRLIDLDVQSSPEAGVVSGLILGPEGAIQPVISSDTTVNYVVIESDTVYVDLALTHSQPLLRFTQSLARTMGEAFGSTYLVLTINGHMPSTTSRSVELCVQSKVEDTAIYQLYYPEKRGQYIVPIIRHVKATAQSDAVQGIFDALMESPVSGDLLGLSNSDSDVRFIRYGRSGDKLSLYIAVPEEDRIDLYGYACIAMSMLRNVAGVRFVRININNAWVKDVPGMDANGGFTVGSLFDITGIMVKLYFAGANGNMLVGVNRAVPFLLAQDPLIAVKEILRGPLDSDPKGITNVFPPNVQQDDFLSFRRHNDLAVIDLSASFYAACANLSLDAEKLLLYAIVNTVTERKDINAVLFTSVGANAQTLSGTISLYRSLLRNPGIISAP